MKYKTITLVLPVMVWRKVIKSLKILVIDGEYLPTTPEYNEVIKVACEIIDDEIKLK